MMSDAEDVPGLSIRQCRNVGSLSPGVRATTVFAAFDMKWADASVTGLISLVSCFGRNRADADRAFGAA